MAQQTYRAALLKELLRRQTYAKQQAQILSDVDANIGLHPSHKRDMLSHQVDAQMTLPAKINKVQPAPKPVGLQAGARTTLPANPRQPKPAQPAPKPVGLQDLKKTGAVLLALLKKDKDNDNG